MPLRLLAAAFAFLTPVTAHAGWTGTSIDTNTVNYVDLVVDPADRPHVAFENTAVHELYIADYSGSSWTVSQPDITNNRGVGTSLAIWGTTQYISYEMTSPKDIYFTKRTNGGTWSTPVVARSGGGNISDNAETSIHASSGTIVHISWFEAKALKYSLSTNGGGSFTTTIVHTGTGTTGVGRYSSVVSTGTTGVHVSYYDMDNLDLRYAFYDGSSWTTQVIDTAGSVGEYTSIGVDASSRPHIAYYDATNGNLKHAYKNSTGTWNVETVDSTGDVGKYASLAMQGDNVHIAYYDLTNGDLKYAKYNGSSWTLETADSSGDVGQWAAIAVDSTGQPHTAALNTAGTLRYAKRTADACGPVPSAGTGNWSNSATWGGVTPSDCSVITVASGHTVTVDITTAASGALTVNGKLKFSRSANSTLTLSGGDLTVAAGGTLDLGTDADPITTVNAKLVLAHGASAGQYGLIVNNGGNFSARGAMKTPFGFATSSLSAGATSLDIAASSATGWAVGDTIVIGPTSGSGVSSAEERVLTGITGTDPLTLSWTTGLTNARTKTTGTPIVVSNLTRSVVVRSSGTSTSSNSAYVKTLTQQATSFFAAHAEFAYLGSGLDGKEGVSVYGGSAAASISSSTFHDASFGLVFNGASSLSVAGLVMHKTVNAGLYIVNSSLNEVTDSVVSASSGLGLFLSAGSKNILARNRVFSGSTGVRLEGTSTDNELDSNALFANPSGGIVLEGSGVTRNTLTGNRSYANSRGVSINLAKETLVLEGYTYSNTGVGLYVDGANSSGTVVMGGALGYDESDTSLGDTGREVGFGSGTGIDVTLSGVKVNPTPGIPGDDIDKGQVLQSYDQNADYGAYRVWGELKVKSGKKLTLDHTKRNRAPAYTGPHTVKGTGHTLTAIVVTTSTVNQLIKTTYQGSDTWKPIGQKAGDMGTIVCAPSSTCPFSHDMVTFNLVTGPSPVIGDRIHLVTHRPTQDLNVQKKLKVGPGKPTNNRGRTKIEAEPGAGIEIKGIPGTPAQIDRLDPSTTFFTIVSSGGFSMGNASVKNADEKGIQLSGSDGVQIDDTVFDEIGSGDGDSATYLTFRELTSTSTFKGLRFDDSRQTPATRWALQVTGNNPGLAIGLQGTSGAIGNKIDDPSGTAVTSNGGPFAPAGGNLSGVTQTALTGTWGANGNDSSSTYVMDASTDSVLYGGAVSSATALTTATVTGLSVNTTYYIRVKAVRESESSAYTSLGSTATLANAPTSTTLDSVTAGAAQVSWSGNGNPTGTLYEAQASTDSGFGAIGASSATRNTTATLPGLTPNTTYHLRVRARNHGGTPTAYDMAVTTATDAAAPVTAAIGSVVGTTAVLTWGANSNPAGTRYTAQMATSTDFGGTLASSQTLATTAAFTTLAPGTTYFFRVKATGHNGSDSAFSNTVSTTSETVPPAALTVAAAAATSVTASWSANGNGAGTQYRAEVSTASDFTGTLTSSETLNTEATLSGLIPDTLYHVRVKTLPDSDYAGGASTVTLANAPAGSAVTAVGTASAALDWDANSNPASTLYEAQASTDAGFGVVNASSATRNTDAVLAGLSANTTYHLRVRAVSQTGTPTAYDSAVSTATNAAAPTGSVVTAATAGSLTLGWSANGNPAGTLYTTQLSTAGDFSGDVNSSTGTAVSANLSGLAANTTYHLRVKATGHGGSDTAYDATQSSPTQAVAPTASAVAARAQTSLTLSWNGGSNPSGTLYVAQVSTASDFTGSVASSATLSASASFAGLAPNTVHHLRVRAVNHAGVPTAYDATQSTATRVNPPAALGVQLLTDTSIGLTWSVNSNPAGTPYTAELSTASDFTGVLTTTQTGGTGVVFAGLTFNTPYHLRVRATGLDGESSADVGLSTTTTAIPPVSPALTSVTETGVALSWNANGNGPTTEYRVQLATTSAFDGVNLTSVTLNTFASYAGLVPDTLYHVRVQAIGIGGPDSAFTSPLSTATLANPPAASAANGVTTGSAALDWSANSNPATTLYEAQASTDAGFGVVNASSATRNTDALFSGLAANTTYHLRVRAVNQGGTATAYDSAVSTATDPAAPLNVVSTAATGGSVTFAWDANGNPGGTRYSAQVSTAADFSGSLTTLALTETVTTFSGLIANTTYHMRVKATGHNGSDTAYAAGMRATLANPPAGSAANGVTTTSASLLWNANSNPAGTLYTAEVSTGAGAIASSATLNTQATLAGLVPNTTYQLRVRASGHGGNVTAYDSSVSTATDAAAPASASAVPGDDDIAFSWTANGNPEGTRYVAQLSTASDFSGTLTVAQTTGTSSAFTGLDLGVLYHLRVKASGHNGSDSAYAAASTATAAGAPASLAVSTYTSTGVSVTWSANGNPGGTQYRAELSTAADFSGTVTSSDTLNLGASFSPLTPNTTYFVRVKALGSPDSAYAGPVSFLTPANAPTTTAVVSVATSTVNLSWSANSNPAGTLYEAQASTDSGFGAVAASSATRDALATLAGLTANTTYHLRVRAVSHGGTPTAYDSAVTTATNAAAPVSANASGTGTVLTLTWGASGNPAGTRYTAQLSTASDFTGGLTALSLTATTTDFSGLTPNTTYHTRVKATGHGGSDTAFSMASATATLANAPASAAANGVTTASASLSFSASGNPAGTLFTVQAATSPDFGTVAGASDTLNAQATIAGLTANTTYHLRARATNHGGLATSYTSAVSTATDAAAPTAAIQSVGGTSIVLSIGANGNPAGTLYTAELSTAADFSGTVTSQDTTGATATFGSLLPNVSYHLRAQAEGHNGSATAFSSTVSTVTTIGAPGSVSVTTTTPTTASVSFDDGGNAPGTLFRAELSTAADFTGADLSSVTANTSASFSGLTPNTTYHLRVKALGSPDSAWSTPVAFATPANAPASSVLTAVGATTATLDWTENSNPAGTRYEAQVSTDTSFGTVTGSSETSDSQASFSGLTPNTGYHFRARTLGHAGTTGFDAVKSSITLAAVPGAPEFSAVTGVSMTVSWSASGNPASSTTYVMERSTAADFSVSVLHQSSGATTFPLPGLSRGTTYYVRVKARDQIGRETAFSATSSTATLPNRAPAAPTLVSPAHEAQLAGARPTFTWSGSDPDGDAITYTLVVGPVADLSIAISSAGLSTTTYTLASNLSAFTTYYWAVLALDDSGAWTGSSTNSFRTGSTQTPPGLASFANQLMTSGATHALALSTSDVNGDSVTVSVTVSSPATINANIANGQLVLTAPAAFYTVHPIPVTVQADDGFAVTTSTFSVRVRPGPDVVPPVPLPPQTSDAQLRDDGSIKLEWFKSPSSLLMDGLPLKGTYEIYFNNGSGEPTTLLTTVPSDGRDLYVLFTSTLPPGTEYRFLIRVRDPWGVVDTYPTYITARSQNAAAGIAHATIRSPKPGDRVWHSGGAQIISELEGSAVERGRVASVRYQYRLTSTTTWTSMAVDATRDALGFYRSYWTAPATGTYELRGVVTDIANANNAAAARAIGVEVVTSSSAIESGTILGATEVENLQKLVCGVGGQDVFMQSHPGDTLKTSARTELDPCAFPQASDIADIRLIETLRLTAPADASLPGGLAPVGHNLKVEVIDFINNVNLSELGPGKYAYVTMTYEDADDDGIVDGTEILESTLSLWHYHAGVWSRMGAQDDLVWVKASAGQSGYMRARTSKFSEFRLIGLGVSPDLTQVGVYPNPFVPNDGNADNGTAFTGAANTGITFINLPGEISLKIYTVTGAEVASFSATNSTGRVQWDARNQDGKDVASGGYIAVITSPGLGRAVRKFLIVR